MIILLLNKFSNSITTISAIGTNRGYTIRLGYAQRDGRVKL